MRLTETLREAFVLAVMQDVPTEDIHAAAKKRAEEVAMSRLPKDVRALYGTHREWVVGSYVSTSGWSFYLPCLEGRDSRNALGKALEGDLRFKELKALRDAQSARDRDLRDMLRGVVKGCNTVKQLKEALPEFAKYAPHEEATSKNLPALANVVAEFSKAGWPKDSRPAEPPKKLTKETAQNPSAARR